MFVDRSHETDANGRNGAGGVAMMTPDERFIQDLYNRAVLNVYEPWTRGVSWVSRAEAARAAYVVSVARQNLAMLAEAEERAAMPRAVRWNWEHAA